MDKDKSMVLYKTWYGMHQRCNNPAAIGYRNYGGKGIKVCERWNDLANFISDMGERPEACSIDRIDNEKGYSPENCRWADRKTQRKNQRPADRRSRKIKGDPQENKRDCLKKLGWWLVKNRYSKTMFSELLGICRSYLHEILAGRRDPSKKIRDQIFKLTKIKINKKRETFNEA